MGDGRLDSTLAVLLLRLVRYAKPPKSSLGWGLLCLLSVAHCDGGSAGVAAPVMTAAKAKREPSGRPAEPVSPAAEPVGPAAPVTAESAADMVTEPMEDEKARLRKLLEYDPKDPLGNLEAADALTGEGASGLTVSPAGPCKAVGTAQRLFTEPIPVALVATEQGFLAAGYFKQGEKEQVRMVRLRGSGLPELLPPLPLEVIYPGPRTARPGLSADRHGVVAVASVDGRGTLRLHRFTLDQERPAVRTQTIKEGVDTRFPPAIAFSDAGTLVAFAVGTTPMHTHVARVPVGMGQVEITDVTPPRLGATAPTFVLGHDPPLLLAVDARDGLSPIVRIPISHEGRAQVGSVVTSVSMVTSPTHLAAASGPGGIRLGYIGMGQASTTAVGIIDVNGGTGPEALVPGTAYGPLHVAVVPLADGLLFAADAPRTGGKSPIRDIVLFHIDERGKRSQGRVRSGEGDAAMVALSRAGAGPVGLALTTHRATYLQRFTCGR